MSSQQCASRRWVLPAVPGSVSEARQIARDLIAEHDVDAELQHAIALCVTEAVTNCVLHAYEAASPPGSVEIEALVQPDTLRVWVRDAGPGLRSSPESPGLGLGMPLMAQLADHLEVRTAKTGGTEVDLQFRLATEAASA